MTVMSQTNSDGTRRCDANCHNARAPRCECICGGANHGVGLGQAMENTRVMSGIVELLRCEEEGPELELEWGEEG